MTRKLTDLAEALETALLAVECRVGQTATQTNRAIAFVQAVELGKSGEYLLEPPEPSQCLDPAVAKLNVPDVASAFEVLQVALFSPRDRPESCVARLDAARAVVTADPADPAKVRAAISQFEKIAPCATPAGDDVVAKLDKKLNAMVEEIKEPLATAEEAVNETRANAAELKRLEAVASPTPAEKEELRKLRDQKAHAEQVERQALQKMRLALRDERQLEERLLEAANFARQLVEIRKEAEGILAKRDEAQKAAAQVEVFERRLHRSRIRPLNDCSGVPCVKSSSLDRRLFLEPQLKDVRQTKILKHSLTVKPDSPYAPKVVAVRPAELTAAYNLDSVLRGLWGISASVIYTDLAGPTFGAVTSEDDAEKKVIAITDETTRAGDFALLADFRLGRWLACRKSYDRCESWPGWFGVEFGAGLGDDPAFFGGISLRPSRSWRFGFGWTYQQIKELRPGQTPGQEVASTDDIRTRDDFAGEWYLSLSFALDSLTLFSAGD